MEKHPDLTIPVKAHLLGLMLAVLLLSCGKDARDEQEKSSERENSGNEMMHDHTRGDGMMDGDSSMTQHYMMSEEMREAMMSGEIRPDMMADMQAIHLLLMNHKQIERRVENLQSGVKTWTTSDNPEIAAAIQKHVREMHERMKEKRPIRQMDPVFRELFDHAGEIEFQIEDIDNGVVVKETSRNPEVVKLIQQHANMAVSEFVENGMRRAMQPTPLPEGYKE